MLQRGTCGRIRRLLDGRSSVLLGFVQDIAYDANCNVSAITDSVGPVAEFNYNAQACAASAAPGPGGAPSNMPIEVRPVLSGPPK